MLYLHLSKNDPLGNQISERLNDMSAAHKVVESSNGESFLRENDHTIKGEAAIFRFLDFYGKGLEAQREISADACYINPETGETC